ncbi:MAG: M48 family metallopeptidase [Myxococcales bacterium]|jgi:predicted Zn-dependent protease
MKSLATVLSSALLLAVSCTTVPVTGRKSLNLVGEGTVNQLGAQTYQQEVSKAKVSTDQNATAMVQRVAQRIAQAAEANFHPNYQWEAKLLDDPKTVNAWCLPGGKMAVYSGILPLTQDETGLAVVLGHETAHALAHHGAERMSRSELLQVGEAGILAAVGAAKPGAVQAVGAALGIGSQVGVELPFSRQQESEADHIGLVLMAKAGYDPAKAVDFWQRMAAYGKGKQPPAFLSDHPSDEDRIAAIKKELPEAKAAYVAHQ